MSDYMDFASLSLADLDAELAAMLATARTKTEARAESFDAARCTAERKVQENIA